MNKWRLMEAIHKAGYSQRSLARVMGINKNTLNSKINGHTPFTTTDIKDLCTRLNITDPAQKAEIFLTESSQ